MTPIRNLMVHGLNELVSKDKLELRKPSDINPCGHMFIEIASKQSVVIWEEIGHDECRITVWWNYNDSEHPQAEAAGTAKERFRTTLPVANRANYGKFVAVCASAWLERKTGPHIQGKGSEKIYHVYRRKDAAEALSQIPLAKPVGFSTEGDFFL